MVKWVMLWKEARLHLGQVKSEVQSAFKSAVSTPQPTPTLTPPLLQHIPESKEKDSKNLSSASHSKSEVLCMR